MEERAQDQVKQKTDRNGRESKRSSETKDGQRWRRKEKIKPNEKQKERVKGDTNNN